MKLYTEDLLAPKNFSEVPQKIPPPDRQKRSRDLSIFQQENQKLGPFFVVNSVDFSSLDRKLVVPTFSSDSDSGGGKSHLFVTGWLKQTKKHDFWWQVMW